MAEYNVVLKDTDGYDICTDRVDGLAAAKKRAKYLLSDDHARRLETTHETIGTDRVEVHEAITGDCVWDAAYKTI